MKLVSPRSEDLTDWKKGIDPKELFERITVTTEAVSWVGTPFCNMGNIKGRRGGVDCGYLILEVFQRCNLIGEKEIKPYSQQFSLHRGDEWYLKTVLSEAREISSEQALPGDIVLYKVGRVYSHGAILLDPWPGKIVHSVNSLGVTITHGVKEGLLKRYQDRKFASFWHKVR